MPGAVEVQFTEDYATVVCRNGFNDQVCYFLINKKVGEKINNWVKGGKTEVIQEVVPELPPEYREMCISGLTPAEWKWK